jgi:hypothetical protein
MNRRKLTQVLLVAILCPALILSGCSAEQWFQIAASLVPIVLQTVGALKTGSGGLSTAQQAALTNFGSLATTILNDVAADIKVAETTTGVIPKIDAELAQLQQQAQALVPQFTRNIAILNWINAILADAIDLANLVPVIQQTASSGATANIQIVRTKVSLPKAKTYKSLFEYRLAQLR